MDILPCQPLPSACWTWRSQASWKPVGRWPGVAEELRAESRGPGLPPGSAAWLLSHCQCWGNCLPLWSFSCLWKRDTSSQDKGLRECPHQGLGQVGRAQPGLTALKGACLSLIPFKPMPLSAVSLFRESNRRLLCG